MQAQASGAVATGCAWRVGERGVLTRGASSRGSCSCSSLGAQWHGGQWSGGQKVQVVRALSGKRAVGEQGCNSISAASHGLQAGQHPHSPGWHQGSLCPQ